MGFFNFFFLALVKVVSCWLVRMHHDWQLMAIHFWALFQRPIYPTYLKISKPVLSSNCFVFFQNKWTALMWTLRKSQNCQNLNTCLCHYNIWNKRFILFGFEIYEKKYDGSLFHAIFMPWLRWIYIYEWINKCIVWQWLAEFL